MSFNRLQIVLVFFCFICLFQFPSSLSASCLACRDTVDNQAMDASNSEAIAKVEKYLNRFFNPAQINVTGLAYSKSASGEKTVGGNVMFFSSENVSLICILEADSNQIREINIGFPENAGFNIADLARATDNAIRSVLPKTISAESGIFLKSIQIIPAKGNSAIDKLTLTLAGNSWNFGGIGTMKLQKTQVQMIYEPSATNKASGNISGELVMGPAKLNLTTQLPSDGKELEFSGKYSGNASSVYDILNGIGGEVLVNDMFSVMPGASAVFRKISVPDYQFNCIPSSRVVTIDSKGSFGDIAIKIAGKEKLGGSLFYKTPSSFKLASLADELAVIDQIGITDLTIVAGNQVSTFGDEQFQSGLNLKGKLNLPEALTKLLGSSAGGLVFTGNIQSTSSFSLGTDIDINATSGDFTFEKLRLSLNKNSTEFLLKGEGDMIFKIDNQNLRFGLHIGTKPLNAAVEAGINLKMVDGQGDLAEWREPFGIPYLTFRTLNGTIGVNPTTLIDKLEVGGDLGIGVIPAAGAEDTRINGALDLSLNVTSPAASRINGSLNELSVNKMIRAFEPGFSSTGALNDLLQTAVKDCKVAINPDEASIDISGSVNLFGKNGNFSLKSSKSSGIVAKGSLDPIIIESGGFTIFAVSGVGSLTTQANFDIQMTADPQYTIDGSLTVLGIQRDTKFVFNKSGFSVQLSGNVLGGALTADMKVSGRSLGQASDVEVEVFMKQEILDMVRKETVAFITNQGKESSSKIQAARAECDKAGSNSAEKAFTSIGSSILQGVDEMQGAMATAGAMIADGVLGSFNIRSIYFKGSASLMQSSLKAKVEYVLLGVSNTMEVSIVINTADAAAMAQKIGEEIGNAILGAFSYLGEQAMGIFSELEEFGQNFVNTMAPVAAELEKGFNDVAKAFEAIGKAADEAWNGRTFESPANGQALSEIKPGIRRYDVSISRVSVLQGEDGNNNIAAAGANAIISTGTDVINEVGGWFTGDDAPPVAPPAPKVADNYLEVWGGIYIKSSNNVFSPPGMNATIWSTNRGGSASLSFTDPKGSFAVGGTKIFYARPVDNPYFFVQSDMFEKDDGASAVEDERIEGVSNAVYIGAINGESRGEFTVRDNKSGVDQSILKIEYVVYAHPMMTSQNVANAIASGDINALTNVMRQGGDLYAADVNALNVAIQNNKVEMVNFLIVNGFKPNTSHLSVAVQSPNYNADLVKKLMVRDAQPGPDVLQASITRKDYELMAMSISHGLKTTKEQYAAAIAQKDYKLAGFIAQSGAAPDINDLRNAVNAHDNKAAELALGFNVVPDIISINKAVEYNDVALFDLLSSKAKPDASSLLLASTMKGNEALFGKILNTGVKATDGQVVINTINNDVSGNLKLALQNGGNASAGLTHAISVNKAESINICLEYGGDANLAIPYAVTNNNVELVKRLLINYSADGNRLLDQAVRSKNLPIAEIALKDGGAQPNPPMKMAADANDEASVRLLLQYGADPNFAMAGSIKNSNVPLLTSLIDMGADVRNSEYLVQTCQLNNLPMTTLLVSQGADANPGMRICVDNNYYDITRYLLGSGANAKGFIATPSAKGQDAIVQLLLDYGDNPDDGIRPAVEGNFTSTALLLLNGGASPKGMLPIAATKGNLPITIALVEAGEYPNDGIREGVNANQLEIVKYLLSQGAIAKDMVVTAASFGNAEMCDVLCVYGDLPQPGMEPAASLGHVAVAKVLVKHGADPKLWKLLFLTVENRHSAMITYLIEQGNNPNDDNGTGEYFLHIVTGDKRRDHDFNSVKALVDGKANLNVLDKEGNTPLLLALENDRKKKESTLYLINAGADLSICDKKGKTPWQRAPMLGEIHNLLKDKNAPKRCGE